MYGRPDLTDIRRFRSSNRDCALQNTQPGNARLDATEHHSRLGDCVRRVLAYTVDIQKAHMNPKFYTPLQLFLQLWLLPLLILAPLAVYRALILND